MIGTKEVFLMEGNKYINNNLCQKCYDEEEKIKFDKMQEYRKWIDFDRSGKSQIAKIIINKGKNTEIKDVIIDDPLNNNPKMNLPKILKHIRTFNKLTQVELSEKLSINRSYISQIEKGVKKPTNETLQKYSEAFDIPLSVIYLLAENLDNKGFKNKAKKLLTKSSLNLLDWICK
jgi:DNA-binding XRE family transcriptional regulator